jgi:hypothetical protein
VANARVSSRTNAPTMPALLRIDANVPIIQSSIARSSASPSKAISPLRHAASRSVPPDSRQQRRMEGRMMALLGNSGAPGRIEK